MQASFPLPLFVCVLFPDHVWVDAANGFVCRRFAGARLLVIPVDVVFGLCDCGPVQDGGSVISLLDAVPASWHWIVDAENALQASVSSALRSLWALRCPALDFCRHGRLGLQEPAGPHRRPPLAWPTSKPFVNASRSSNHELLPLTHSPHFLVEREIL